MSGPGSLNNSTSKRVLNLLEPVKLTVWKVMIERVTVVKFRVNYGGDNGAVCFEVKVWADTAKFTDVIVARLRKCSDLIREGKVSSKIKPRLRAEWMMVALLARLQTWSVKGLFDYAACDAVRHYIHLLNNTKQHLSHAPFD